MSDQPFGDTELQFPLSCQFRIVADSAENVQGEIKTTLGKLGFSEPVQEGNTSAKGRYRTYHVELVVQSRDQMNAIDEALRRIEGVRMVL